MKLNWKAFVAGTATLAVAGGGLLISAGAASAASSAPAWEPDPSAAAPYGNVVFYDAQGNQVTSGTNLTNPFSYAVAATAADAGAIKASLAYYLPVNGQNPQTWSGASESGPTTFSPATSLPSGTPADVAQYAPTHPVIATSTNNITVFANNFPSSTTDTTSSYYQTIAVRITDSKQPSGTYWQSDIAYNESSSPITVDGTTVPANGWAEVFPLVSPTTTTVAPSAPSVVTGNPITLTATVSNTTAAGTVNFFDNGTLVGSATPSGGTATFTESAPAKGAHNVSASFVPTLGDETGAGTSSATIVGGSTGTSSYTVTGVVTATSTSLSANPTSVSYNGTTTLTATVTEADSAATGVAGTVQFLDGTSPLGSPVATTVSGTTGTATLTTTPGQLAVGTNNITAQFSPTDSADYTGSTSSAVPVVEAANPVCNNTGSSCTDTQNIQVTVNAGSITVSTPYTSASPFVLPPLTLSTDGSYLSTSATFPNAGDKQILVTSTLAGDPSWTLSVAATPLTDAGGDTIAASGLGLTGGKLATTSTIPGGVSFTDIPAHNPSALDTDTNKGLGSTPQTFATSPAGDGTAVMSGTLTLLAPTSTPQGTYNGTITFSVV